MKRRPRDEPGKRKDQVPATDSDLFPVPSWGVAKIHRHVARRTFPQAKRPVGQFLVPWRLKDSDFQTEISEQRWGDPRAQRFSIR